jgi:hypothetical protein
MGYSREAAMKKMCIIPEDEILCIEEGSEATQQSIDIWHKAQLFTSASQQTSNISNKSTSATLSTPSTTKTNKSPQKTQFTSSIQDVEHSELSVHFDGYDEGMCNALSYKLIFFSRSSNC